VKAGAVALIATFLVGLIIGIQSGGEPETKYKVIHDTETVTKTETVEVPGPPPSECADVVKYSRDILRAGKQFDKTTAGMLDIMSRLRIAAATGDGNEANDLETELRQLDGKTIGAVETLGTTEALLDAAAAACLGGQ
jgi:hypothetical protein